MLSSSQFPPRSSGLVGGQRVLLGFGCDNGWVNPLDSLDVKGLGFRVGSIEWEGGKKESKVLVFVMLCYYSLSILYSQKLIMKIL